MARKASDIVAVKLRMREDLRRQIERLAKKDGRSVNAMTVRLLEDRLREPAGPMDIRDPSIWFHSDG